ncbi:uncharacterized protein LOC143300521 isoform X2 [Babylonia areolata]|uniref:uncharacterized protein LOC143300521 isoform X2 n=1 Tax=Babylonia areolata TaxID=304850 RepID=UPI003FCFBF70
MDNSGDSQTPVWISVGTSVEARTSPEASPGQDFPRGITRPGLPQRHHQAGTSPEASPGRDITRGITRPGLPQRHHQAGTSPEASPGQDFPRGITRPGHHQRHHQAGTSPEGMDLPASLPHCLNRASTISWKPSTELITGNIASHGACHLWY